MLTTKSFSKTVSITLYLIFCIWGIANVQGIESSTSLLVSVILKVTYTPTYPDEVPVIEVVGEGELSNDHIEELKLLVNEQVTTKISVVYSRLFLFWVLMKCLFFALFVVCRLK